jgi:hypothetical protein
MLRRLLNVIVGAGVLASAFSWSHNHAEFLNAIAVGSACIATAAIALTYRPARYLNAALGVWLFGSWVVLPVKYMGTVYTDLILGGLMMGIAFTGSVATPRTSPLKATP